MQVPMQITFRGLQHSDAVESRIREKVAKLARVCEGIQNCRILVETPHRHQAKGRRFHIRLDISVPGKEIVVKHDNGDRQAHEDVYVTLRDAFGAARRQLEEYAQRMHRKVKTHAH